MKSPLIACLLMLISGFIFAQDTDPAERPVSLKEVVDLALKNNLDIAVETYNPEIQDTRIKFEKSQFEPFFAATLDSRDSTNPTGSILVGEQAITTEDLTYNFQVEQRLRTGTRYSVLFNNNRIETNQSFTSVNPRFDSSLFANVTQPLMRGFGTSITQTPVKIAEQNRLAADHRLRQRVLDVALQVEQA